MGKKLILWVLLLCLLPLIPAFAAHECVDIYGAELLLVNYKAPTETEDGYTGDEVCSYCSQKVHTGSRIPSLLEQRGQNATPKPAEPDPTATPRPAEPDPTAAPKPADPDPTAAPKPSDPDPTAAPKPADPDPTAAPKPADPDPTAGPTSVPKITVSPVTPQPDLSREPAVQQSQTQDAPSSSSSSSSSGRSSSSRTTRRGSGKATPTPAVSSSRDLFRYPFFSDRFPWRRLRMTPPSDLTLMLAGELVWPQEDPASPLMMLMIPGS